MDAERILVIDDEPGVRSAVEAILRDEGFSVAAAGSGEEGLEIVARETFDAVLLDVWLPGIDGLETLAELRDRRVDAQVVMISGHGNIETAVKATKLGAFDFVEKPLSLEKTLLVLRNALKQRRLERRNRQLLQQLDRDTEIIGRSASAERLRADVSAAAVTDAPVLVHGERGTGRENVARRIHAQGRGAAEPFVQIPCGSLDSRASAEALFGDSGRESRVSMATGGTLFLEDADALDPGAQERLAAAIPGGRAAGIRFIGSAAEVSRFHPAILAALDVIRIEVPPLRQRREDIPFFVERFMRDLAHEYGRDAKRLSEEAISALVSHSWPGNVRELRNLVERLLLLVPAEEIRAADLPAPLGKGRAPAEDLYREFASLAEGLASFERYYIARILTEERGGTEVAARRLGLSARDLADRVARLGIR